MSPETSVELTTKLTPPTRAIASLGPARGLWRIVGVTAANGGSVNDHVRRRDWRCGRSEILSSEWWWPLKSPQLSVFRFSLLCCVSRVWLLSRTQTHYSKGPTTPTTKPKATNRGEQSTIEVEQFASSAVQK